MLVERQIDGLPPLQWGPRGLERLNTIREDGWAKGVNNSAFWVPGYEQVPNKYYHAMQLANTASEMGFLSMFLDPKRRTFDDLGWTRQFLPNKDDVLEAAIETGFSRVFHQLVKDAWSEAAKIGLPFVLTNKIPMTFLLDDVHRIDSPFVDGILTCGLCGSKPQVHSGFSDDPPPKYSASFTHDGKTVFSSGDGAAGAIDGDGRLRVAVAPTKFKLPEWVGAVGFKAATSPGGAVIVIMLIPKESRTNVEPAAPHNKFRTERVYTVAILPVHRGRVVDHLLPRARAMHDERFVYLPEKEQRVRNFETKRDVRCGPGIHFYLGAAGALKHMGVVDANGVQIAERYAQDAIDRLRAGPI